jgi:FHS family L-fucose permease-like MFS transporter
VQFAFFSAYFVFSIPSAKVVDWIGYKNTMVAGLLTMGLGAFLFVPAAMVPSYPLFLGALIVLAAGITALQVAANPYVTVLGKPEKASTRLNLTQAFNSLGTTIAPFLGGIFILAAAPLTMIELRALPPQALQDYRIQQAASVKMPYVVLGIVLVLLAVAIASFKLPKIESAQHQIGQKVNDSIWNHPNLIFGAIAIFVYVGGEVSIGSFLVNYFSQPDIAGLSEKVAAGFVSFYWGGAMVGRFIGSALLNGIKAIHMAIVTGVSAVLTTVAFLVHDQSFPREASKFHVVLANVQNFLVNARPFLILCTVVTALILVMALAQKGRVTVKTGHLLGLCAVSTTALVVISMLTSGHVAMWAIIFVGLFNSIMFPSIFTLGVAELGPLTGDGSGVMIMAIVGGAIIPVIQGAIADRIGIHHAFVLPVICYLYILYFALWGSRPNSERHGLQMQGS